ncbi:hypothetical protein GW17_00062154 [Ensete ventricosum]|nr:hypothetical protein GW17_00062154 [Ensete ventricosum]RZS25620.1 hypothetical protein BHM03_00058876 [Ensete ventricosum]
MVEAIPDAIRERGTVVEADGTANMGLIDLNPLCITESEADPITGEAPGIAAGLYLHSGLATLSTTPNNDRMSPRGSRNPERLGLEMMSMNLKEGGLCVVNRDEDLTAADFSGDVHLAKKESAVLLIAMKI